MLSAVESGQQLVAVNIPSATIPIKIEDGVNFSGASHWDTASVVGGDDGGDYVSPFIVPSQVVNLGPFNAANGHNTVQPFCCLLWCIKT
jgi:hypothetical protein